jgi:hypothetical protein
VAGTPVGCDAITPIGGTKSMWCGQWTTALEPWCGWATLPGYGNGWDQSLESTVSNVTSVSYAIAWDTEPGYDYGYLEWYDPVNLEWVADPAAGGGAGKYTGSGSRTENLASPYGATKVRFHFESDGAWSDQDGLWPTVQGAMTVDNVAINGGVAETFEGAACGATNAGDWVATKPPGFGIYAHLVLGATALQEDPCYRNNSWLWAFFDDPATTNYGCGGWPTQGAIPYGPTNGYYLDNEIWSPWVPITGAGSEYILSFLVYRNLPLNSLVFYMWHVQTKATGGCPVNWGDLSFVYYGAGRDWQRAGFQIGSFIRGGADEIRVALGVIDLCSAWGGIYGDCACHTQGPLFDEVKLQRVESYGPQYTYRDIDMWQDNFPEDGTVTGYARCDMAQDIVPATKKTILPGDSLKIVATDPNGLATDNTGGRPGNAVYVFVRCTDRFGTPRPYSGLQMQSPDNRAWAADLNAGLLRWPLVTGVTVTPPAGWEVYRVDQAYTSAGGVVKDTYCADLMDLAAGPDGPPYHPNENWAANTGLFRPGDIIWYFFGAKNTLGQWSYLTRLYQGQGSYSYRTNNIAECTASPMEWSVLPDAGRQPGDLGDILFVDDADDRGGPAQLYFDWCWKYFGLEDRVDRFDVLGPSSVVGNSLASRVKAVGSQIIGSPVEIYQKILWNCSDLNRGLMGDGGTPNGGSSAEKSDDFGLCNTFLNTHTNHPGWAYWGDDVVSDWNALTGLGALAVQGSFMNFAPPGNDQRTITGVMSPGVLPVSPLPTWPWLPPSESFYAYGGCAVINDFDVPAQAGLSMVAHRYNDASAGPNASLSQWRVNAVGDTARFFLAGFGFNFIRDDDAVPPPDYAVHLREILRWFQNEIGEPIGIDLIAFENRLDNACPNPFNPTTTIKFSIADAGRVTLKIYNAAGQLIRTLVDEEKAPVQGGFSVDWNGLNDYGKSVASGVYFYRLTAKDFSQTKKMVLLK